MTMHSRKTAFTWYLNQRDLKPPRGRPEAPFGPTSIEMIRTCGLRACFERSQGYERRTAYAARVGIAFHNTLQSLTEYPIRSETRSEIIAEAHRRFYHELSQQEEQKNSRPREQLLPRDEERIHRALEALASESLRLTKQFTSGQSEYGNRGAMGVEEAHLPEMKRMGEGKVLVEIPIQSHDGLLTGRVDYAERLATGLRLLDYKSALRDELPARYERQLQLYALLWYETFGEWPQEAWVTYPLTGARYRVAIDPEICRSVGNEARVLIKQVQECASVEQLAAPGETCALCEFRPWCQPFWQWQAQHSSHSVALQTAAFGFEGKVLTKEVKNDYWIVTIQWRDAEVRLVIPQERFPQLKNVSPGAHIRILDVRLRGQRYRPQAIVIESSEIYLVE